MVAEKCCTCMHSCTTGKDRIYCKKSLADKDDCGEYKRISEEGRMANEELKQEPCEDCISREAVLSLQYRIDDSATLSTRDVVNVDDIEDLPPATPQPKTGRWLRMSDLSEQEDDRYKCSRCGNVVHCTNKMNLYAFNSWCGRCGSDNGRHINQESGE